MKKSSDKTRAIKKPANDLGLNYGLGIGFDPKTVKTPFYAGNSPKTGLFGSAGTVERCADLADDRLHKKTVARLKKEFGGRDDLADWIRQNSRSGLIVHLKKAEISQPSTRIDVDLKDGATGRLLIVAEPEARGTVIVRRQGKGQATGLIEIHLGQGSEINLVRIQDLGSSENHNRLQANLEPKSKLNLSECLFGGSYTASWSDARLSGAESEVNSRTLLVGAQRERFDLYCAVQHLASKTKSSINTASAILDAAKVVDRGLITVHKGAKGCSGKQKADTILLSDKADYASQPQLEVNEEDARCSHASAIGHLNPESLFYLLSRGLNETEARRRLVEGFVDPILVDMKEAGLEEMINCLIAQRF